MDWANADARDVVLAICGHWRLDFAQAEDYLLARQLQEAEERGAGGAQQGAGEEEEVVADDAVIPMPGRELITVGAAVVGTGENGLRDGAVAQAMFGGYIFAMLFLPDGRVLLADYDNHRIRVLSADLQQVSMVAGDGEDGHQDGAAAQTQFNSPCSLTLLSDGRVLMAEQSHRIRMLSADLQQVSTVAGDGETGYRDGAAAQAQFNDIRGLAVLPGGRGHGREWAPRRRGGAGDVRRLHIRDAVPA